MHASRMQVCFWLRTLGWLCPKRRASLSLVESRECKTKKAAAFDFRVAWASAERSKCVRALVVPRIQAGTSSGTYDAAAGQVRRQVPAQRADRGHCEIQAPYPPMAAAEERLGMARWMHA